MTAAPSITDILARVAVLEEHTVAPPALAPLSESRSIERELRSVIGTSPEEPRAYAALGNLLARRGLYLAARDAYRNAVERDDSYAQAHLAIAELSSMLRDAEAAATHLRRALALRRRYDDPLPVDGRVAVLLLLRDETYAVNAPLELILDRARVAVHKLYVGGAPLEDTPTHDVAVCAFGPAYGADESDERAVTLAGVSRLLNRPDAIARCARERLHESLAGISTVASIETRLMSPQSLDARALPALVRPAGTHAGTGLRELHTPADIAQHLETFPSHAYHVSRMIDYRSPDGYYRKYRIIIVDGVAYPYHLAISPRWMVHYQSSPMEEHAWMREEEAAFLHDPRAVFAAWDESTERIAYALQLEYVGLDVTRSSDGSMLVFEADPAMLVHDEDPDGPLSYKRPFVATIREALHGLLSAEKVYKRAAPQNGV